MRTAPSASRYDVRRYRPAVPGGFLAAVARDLLGAIGRLDAVGGDLVTVGGRVGPGLALVRHPDLVRALLIDENDGVTKARGLRLAAQLLGQGLLTSEPPIHTRQRRLVLPAFHHRRLRAYGREMVAQTAAEADAWTAGAPFDAAAAANRLALAIAGRTLFSADVLTDADRVRQALADAMVGFDRSQFPFADKLAWLPTSAARRTKRARAVLDDVVYGLIRQRREVATDRHDDLLSLLLDARDDETGEGMTDEEVRDEVMTLLLAGHETTAVALAWTWALLAEHPAIEAALFDEVDALPADPTFDSLSALPLTRRVLAESMRLRPPAWAVGRQAARDLRLCGVPVAAGTTLLFAPLFLHRDPRFWPDPDRADPERHTPAASRERHKFAYLPFSAGRRGCIGEPFAWAEGTLALATVARRWRLRLDRPVPPPHGSVTLRLAGPLVLRPEPR